MNCEVVTEITRWIRIKCNLDSETSWQQKKFRKDGNKTYMATKQLQPGKC